MIAFACGKSRAKNYFSVEPLRVIMAKRRSRTKRNATKGIGRFQVEMSSGVRLLLAGCMALGFLIVLVVIWWIG